MNDIKNFFEKEDLFARHSGIVLLDVSPGSAKAEMLIRPHHFNGAKTVHGGAIFTLADFTFAAAANSHGTLAMGINTAISYVKAATCGTLHALAAEVARNSKLATYSVTVSDDNNDVVALFQGTVYRKKEPLLNQKP